MKKMENDNTYINLPSGEQQLATNSTTIVPQAQVGVGGNDQFMCEICNRTFGKLSGKNLHIRKAHQTIANAAIKVDRVKARWTNEESQLLARAEAEGILEGARFINKYLVERFPQRTLEAIKGRRKNPEHHMMLQHATERITAERARMSAAEPRDPDDEVNNSFHIAGNLGVGGSQGQRLHIPIQTYIRELLSELPDDNKGYQLDKLSVIAQSILDGEDKHKELYAWLCEVFKVPNQSNKANPRLPKTAKDRRHMSSRKKRRADYIRIQKLWQKNMGAASRLILDGEPETSPIPMGEFEDFWSSQFEAPSREAPPMNGPAYGDPNGLDDVWRPISRKEVEDSRPKGRSAAGPDRIKPVVWANVPTIVRTLFFNLLVLNPSVPPELTAARTVFIPKKAKASTPSDYRPISVGSVVTRQLNVILAKRLTALPIHDTRQVAFNRSDGLAGNLYLLQTILGDARTRRKPVYLASMDVSKAFDSVSHHAVLQTLSRLGLPDLFVQYVAQLYNRAYTIFERDGQKSRKIRMNRGVRQGDPLSPIIFNMVIDRALRELRSEIGYDIDTDHRVGALAFADDVFIVAQTSRGLQENLDRFTNALRSFGLDINVSKSFSLGLVPSGREKKVKVLTEPEFHVSKKLLPMRSLLDTWRYLGIEFEGTTVRSCDKNLEEDLIKLTKSPTKPQQKLKVLTQTLLPRHFHVWALGRVNSKYLRGLDLRIRREVRKWMRLPNDCPTSYIHGAVRDGGLGVPELNAFVPWLRLKRIRALAESPYPQFRAAAETPLLVKQKTWCEKHLDNLGVKLNSDPINTWQRSKLNKSVDCQGLTDAARCSASTHFMTTTGRNITGRDFVDFVRLRANAIPTRARCARGRPAKDRTCRAGCGKPETTAHVVQQCFRSHGGRVKRHDRVVDILAGSLKQKGYSVFKELTIPCLVGNRRPDIVVVKEGMATVIDAQVVGESISLDENHKTKASKYREVVGLSELLARLVDVEESCISFTSATISYRGIWSGKSSETLRELGISLKVLSLITVEVLRGSHMNWTRFNKTTMQR